MEKIIVFIGGAILFIAIFIFKKYFKNKKIQNKNISQKTEDLIIQSSVKQVNEIQKEELRKRLLLKEEQWQELVDEYGCKKTTYVDFYYDNPSFLLSRQNLWLRKRFDQNSNFVYQLIRMDNSGNVDSYEKYEDLEKIKEICNIHNFDEIDFKLKTFCELKVQKEIICLPHSMEGFRHFGFKFVKNLVTSLDKSSWNYIVYDLKYARGVEGLSFSEKTQVIDLMCKESKWDNAYMYCRVIEYLRNFSENHFNKLTYSGVCPPYPENIAVV